MKIIRTRQRPFLRLVDTLLTVLAWGGLMFLLVQGLVPMLETHGGPRLDAPIFAALNTLQIYLYVGLFNAGLLILWARYQQRRGLHFARRRVWSPVLSDDGLSESFNLTEDRLQRLRLPGVLVIHNDQEGGLSEVSAHRSHAESLLVAPRVQRPELALVRTIG